MLFLERWCITCYTVQKPCCRHSSLSLCYPSTSGIFVISTQAPGSETMGAQLIHSPTTHLSLCSLFQPSSPRVGDWITSPSATASARASSFLLWTQTQRLRLGLSPVLSSSPSSCSSSQVSSVFHFPFSCHGQFSANFWCCLRSMGETHPVHLLLKPYFLQ